MNDCYFMGNLGRDPVVKCTQNEAARDEMQKRYLELDRLRGGNE